MASNVDVIITAQDNFSGVLGSFGSIITGIESAIHLAADAFKAFSGFALEGLEAIGDYERLSATLQTLVAGQMLSAGAADSMAEAMGNAELKAGQLLEWVQELAIHSPFTQAGVADAFRMAMAYGFTAEEAQRLTQAMIDFAAGSGASEDAMSRIALALGQIEAKGKLSGQEVLQLVNAGIAVDQILADAFGKTTAEIVAMRADGLIPAKDAIEALTVYMETNFAGAAERQAFTWAGLLSTFEDLKTIGLREFFTEMANALQPLAVAFADWMQDEGMAKLREWGEILGRITEAVVGLVDAAITGKLYDFGTALQSIAGTDSIFYALGTAIRVFQQALDDGSSIRDAFLEGLAKFTDLSGINSSTIAASLQGLVATFLNALDNVDWVGLAEKFDTKLAEQINKVDWREVGDALGIGIMTFLVGPEFLAGDSAAAQALGNALSEFLLGAMGYINWDQVWAVTDEAMINLLENIGISLADQWSAIVYGVINFIVGTDSMRQIGKALSDGFKAAFESGWSLDLEAWCQTHIVDPIKKFFGIASPSTVFMGIGRDLVLGLIAGVGSMWATFASYVGGLVNGLLSNFSIGNILDALGGGLGGATGDATGTLGGSGSVGGRIPTLPGGSISGGQVVNQYFAGATINVGSWDEIIYDCVYPNPFVAATSGQLGGGGGGGPTGGR